MHRASVLVSDENRVSMGPQYIDDEKKLASKSLDVSSQALISETKDSAIKESARPDTAGAQGIRIIRISKPPSKNSPEHYWSESSDNYFLRMKQ